MDSIAHHKYRLWVMFLVTFNLIMMIADYSYLAALVAKANDPYDSMTPGDTHILRLFWTDYRHINRFARGFSVLALAVLLITVASKFIDEQIKFASIFIAPGSSLVYKPFTCVGAETTSCNLILANIFIALITGLFSFIEVLWTFSFKPFEAKQEY
ncbi:hypothetical protein BGZ97_008246 [Linnemannia gamsii]|uniref:Uncharacterized protein n=1 Tax=Linnemannia gamsii TaxID=64522 RepID=A0A9P6QMF0_9FUNG|nr:hypothetical protein BGZ97_008246 [Linnemannia gamsii]